jgi:hypothetical protein
MKIAVILLCCFNISWILYIAGMNFSHEHIFSLVCQLFTLYFVVNTGHAPVIQMAEVGVDNALLRRQIQEINWRILWYKVSVLSFIKNPENDRHRGMRNSKSEIIHKRSTSPYSWVINKPENDRHRGVQTSNSEIPLRRSESR